MKTLFLAYLAVVTGFYAVSAYRGWDLGSSKRGFIPPSARQAGAAGGYRSFGYWRGGK
jgi:hypothetical protein